MVSCISFQNVAKFININRPIETCYVLILTEVTRLCRNRFELVVEHLKPLRDSQYEPGIFADFKQCHLTYT